MWKIIITIIQTIIFEFETVIYSACLSGFWKNFEILPLRNTQNGQKEIVPI